jgi:FkbM family methyltransferase
MSDQQTIQSLVPGGKPVDLIAYYPEFEWYYPNCEPETKYWFVRNVQPDWVIFDVGANVGYYAVLFSRLAHRGSVCAFEPTATADMLRRNLAHNGCANVQVEEIALGSKTGNVEDGIYRMWGDEPERKVYPFYRLDDYVRNNNITKLDCIKIDVDSFDFEVLLGARETIRTLKPTIVVELNHALSRRNQSNIKALEWLRDQGIDEVLSLDGDNFVVTPGRRPSDTFPTHSSMRIAFADPAALPQAVEDEGAIKVIKSFDPHHAAVTHGQASITVLAGSQIEVTTPAAQWAYAVGFPAPVDLAPNPALRVLMDVQVTAGRVGIGCLSSEGAYIGPERQIGAGGRRSVLLPVTDPANLAQVMVRNSNPEGAASTVQIFGVKIGLLEEGEGEGETSLPVQTLARRVHEAEASEAGQQDLVLPASDGEIGIVDYAHLPAALGFSEPYAPPAGAADGPLVFWRMERDDAPLFSYIYRNLQPARHLEFGTWEGFGAKLCAETCAADIWTLNLPDGEKTAQGKPLYAAAQGGDAVQTDSGEFIGRLYREAGYAHRVHQILVDSTQWQPDMAPGFFDCALIDGGHTEDVVVSDTDKTIPLVRPGGIVMWHDFCPDIEALQANAAPRGVLKAIAHNHHRWREHFSQIFWVKPSWVLVGVRR